MEASAMGDPDNWRVTMMSRVLNLLTMEGERVAEAAVTRRVRTTTARDCGEMPD